MFVCACFCMCACSSQPLTRPMNCCECRCRLQKLLEFGFILLSHFYGSTLEIPSLLVCTSDVLIVVVRIAS